MLHVLCRGQRFSTGLVRVAVNPAFSDTFIIDVTPSTASRSALPPLSSLLRLENHTLHFTLCLITQGSAAVHVDASPALTEDVSLDVVASCSADWRNVLSKPDGRLDTLISLTAAGPGPHRMGEDASPVPAGLLQVSVQLCPPPVADGIAAHARSQSEPRMLSTAADLDSVPLYATDVKLAMDRETGIQRDAERSFSLYAKAWWGEFKSLHPSYRRRYVKIYAENERGEELPVVCFVAPLAADRIIESPYHAARFVSLIPFRRGEAIIGGGPQRRSVWHAPHVTLAIRQGDVEDHAVMLCGLLLGFGLEAYVALGTRADGHGEESEHAWVVLRYAGDVSPADTGTVQMAPRVEMWEALTGARMAVGDVSPSGHRFARVACIFNHERFLANVALDDTVEATRWALDDITQWKAMEVSYLQALRHVPFVPLAPPSLDARVLAASLEATLKRDIAAYRSTFFAATGEADAVVRGWATTSWDSHLEYQLSTALTSYEMERLMGVSTCGPEFASSIKRYVPRGHAFRGFPMMFNHISPVRIMEALKAADAARAVMQLACPQVSRETGEAGVASTWFALRVHVYVMAEDALATWSCWQRHTPPCLSIDETTATAVNRATRMFAFEQYDCTISPLPSI